MTAHRYRVGERLPIEVLVFEMDPAVVGEFLVVDHEVWTLGEALLPGFDRIPFLSKEVWLDDSRPGRVTLVFVWESIEAWDRVDDAAVQTRLMAEFDARFRHSAVLVEAWHEETGRGLSRWSRFERVETEPADQSDGGLSGE